MIFKDILVGECLESHVVYDSSNEQDNEELLGIDIYYALNVLKVM